MTGCRYDAKNTLDKNYLYLAERAGAVVLPERKVVRIKPFENHDDSGYEPGESGYRGSGSTANCLAGW